MVLAGQVILHFFVDSFLCLFGVFFVCLLFLFQTLGWLVGYALFTWLQSKGLISLSQVCCKINFNHLQHHPIYPHGHALHTTSSLWSNINLADPRDHNHDHLSPVPVDMGQPVPGVNIGAHLLQERNQTHPTCYRRSSRTGCHIQVMIQWKWYKALSLTSLLKDGIRRCDDLDISETGFFQGRLEHPSPPPDATYHAAPYDLQGFVFLLVNLILSFLHLLSLAFRQNF